MAGRETSTDQSTDRQAGRTAAWPLPDHSGTIAGQLQAGTSHAVEYSPRVPYRFTHTLSRDAHARRKLPAPTTGSSRRRRGIRSRDDSRLSAFRQGTQTPVPREMEGILRLGEPVGR